MSAFDIVFATLTILLGLTLLALFVLATYHYQGPRLRKGLALARRFIGWAWSLLQRFVAWTATNLPSALGRLVRFLVKLPATIVKAISWLISKLAILIGIFVMLDLYLVALGIVLWAIQSKTQCVGCEGIFVAVMVWGSAAIALIIALAITWPFFKLVRKLAS